MAPHDLTLAEFHDLDQMRDDNELPVARYCQTKRAWDGAGGFIASPYDKTLSI